ncbi:MAG: TolC family protein [Microscillaceae bacterium]|nr:TolC family protein [Microscillaceae bacterium]
MPGQAQPVYNLTDIIAVAQRASIRALIAKNTRQNRFWQYRTYLSNFKPQLLLDGNLPNFSRAILQNRNDDGSIGFIDVSNLNTDLGLSLRQTIAATGTEIFVSSTLARLQNFGDIGGNTQYSSNLVQVGLTQALFNFNASRWERRIEPIRYEESVKKYSEDIEGIAIEATTLFFDLIDAQTNLEIAQTNLANNDTIFQIGQQRYELGTITENDLLQLQLNVLNASQQVSQARLSIETSTLALKVFWAILMRQAAFNWCCLHKSPPCR